MQTSESPISRHVFLRLPSDKSPRLLHFPTAPRRLQSIMEAKEGKGFLIAPFDTTSPLLFWPACEEETLRFGTAESIKQHFCKTPINNCVSQEYEQSFKQVKEALKEERAKKVVLARTQRLPLKSSSLDAETEAEMFRIACEKCPTAAVMLIHTPETGIWLFASPELLLEARNGNCRTMALAGSRNKNLHSETLTWSEKNQHEHAEVVNFIKEILQPIAHNLHMEPQEVIAVAGNIEHLRTIFTFQLPSNMAVAQLLHALPPTPAVCGVPRNEAYHIIQRAEPQPRQFYAGYFGLLNGLQSTALYVSLRGMQLTEEAAVLYAGGGIMPESDLKEEWHETERKLLPMRTILQAFQF